LYQLKVVKLFFVTRYLVCRSKTIH